MNETRVIIAGSRLTSIRDEAIDCAFMHLHMGPIAAILEGGAPGVDCSARIWAEANGIPVETFKPDWDLGRMAGPIRNHAMAMAATHLLAFPGGRGTQDMINRARNQRLTILQVDVDGNPAATLVEFVAEPIELDLFGAEAQNG